MFLIVLFVLLVPTRAEADLDRTIEITHGKPSADPSQVDTNGTVTWRNEDDTDHEIEFEQGAVAVPANDSSEPIVISHSFQYKIDNDDHHDDLDDHHDRHHRAG